MRYDIKIAIKEYNQIKEYLEKYGYKSETTGSMRRKKSDVGDIDIVVCRRNLNNKEKKEENLKELEEEVLNLILKYEEIDSRINYYEFQLKSGISIHMIPEISKHYNYTLWHSTGPKPHVKLIKEKYKTINKEIDMIDTVEEDIYKNLEIKYLKPEERYKMLGE